MLFQSFPVIFFISLTSQESTNSQTSARHWSMDKTHCLSMQSSMWKRKSSVLSNLEVSIPRVSSDSEQTLKRIWREGACVWRIKGEYICCLPWLSIHLLIKRLSACWLERADLLDNILRHEQGISEGLGWSSSFATDIVSEWGQIMWSFSASVPHLWNGFDGSLVCGSAVKCNCHFPKYYCDEGMKIECSMIAMMGVIWHPLNGQKAYIQQKILKWADTGKKKQVVLTVG